MAVEGAIVTRMEAYGGLTALVGSGDSARIYPAGDVPDQVTEPYVAYQFLGGPRDHAMSTDPGVRHSRVQTEAVDTDYDDARAVAVQVEAALSRWSGTADSTTVHDILVESEALDTYEPDPGPQGLYRIVQAFIVHHD